MLDHKRQIKHFELYEKAGLKVYVWDGAGHKKFYDENKRSYKISHTIKKMLLVKDRLRFDGREVVIEADNEKWELNKERGDKIKHYLDKSKIPYELILTGGKGLRFHIFLDTTYPQRFVFATYIWLCKQIEVLYKDKDGFDWKLHGVPENKAKHHLLGCIGKTGKQGYWATWWDKEIPKERPKTFIADVKFPTKVEMWPCPDAVRDDIEREYELIPIPLINRVYNTFRYRKPMMVKKW